MSMSHVSESAPGTRPVIVIGAGPAGLTAALELTTHGRKVIVVEALDNVGGISRTVTTNNGCRMDLGGHRFFTKSRRVSDFWHSVGDLLVERQRQSHILYRGHLLTYPVAVEGATFRAMGFLGTIRAAWGYMCAAVHKRREDSLEDFYINRFGRGLYNMFFESYTAKVWGVHPSQLSPDWGAQRVKSLSVGKVLKDMLSVGRSNKQTPTTLIRRFEYPPLGPGQLWEAVAKKVVDLGGELILGRKVTEISVENGRVTSVSLDDGTQIATDTVISSMPLKDLVDTLKGASLDADVVEAARELPYRDFIIVGVLVKKSELKMSLTDNWIYIQDNRVRVGRLQVFNNWSPDMVADPDQYVWLGMEYFANEGDDLWSMAKETMEKFAVDELVTIGIINSADAVVGEAAVVHVPKAYPCYMGTYDKIDKIRDTLDSIGGLWVVGRAGQHRYNNMDHSMLTAMYAADAILNGSEDRSPVWGVNTTDDYHEE